MSCPPPCHHSWQSPDHFQGGAGDIDVMLVVKHSLAGVNCSLVLGFRDLRMAVRGRRCIISLLNLNRERFVDVLPRR